MKLVVLGLSLSSSWGNGHATTFRAMLSAFAGRGHAIRFLAASEWGCRKLVVPGLSLSSSGGNGHATTFRALLAAFAGRGQEIRFLERDVPWYAGQRDLIDPAFCRLEFYDSVEALEDWRHEIETADAVMVGSYVPDGIAVGHYVQRTARGVTAFYDIDTPVTLAALREGRCGYQNGIAPWRER